MSKEIVLYTPATGFPDLEAKIAYGLARVGIEAGNIVSVIPFSSFYQVLFESQNEMTKINEAFRLLLNRFLSTQRFYDLGVKAKYRKKYPPSEEVREELAKIDLVKLYQLDIKDNFEFTKQRQCGHSGAKFGATEARKGQLGGLILIASVHAGKPQYRDIRRKDLNLGLCGVCGYLNVLGKESFCFTAQIGTGKNKKWIVVTPIPKRKLEHLELSYLISMQKTLHNFWLSGLIPLNAFTIGLLAKVPSLSDIINDLQLDFHLALLSKDNRGDTVVEQTMLVNTMPFTKFISFSAYNSASVDKLLSKEPKIPALMEITNTIKNSNLSNLSKFARLYVQETSTDNRVNFLYPETTKYLLGEVGMIKPEIIKNKAINSLARTLRYFVRERKYHYADALRNARKESKDFEETMTKMLREGRLRLEQKEKIHLPNDEEVKEVFQLVEKDFEGVKTAIVLLGLSFSSLQREEEVK